LEKKARKKLHERGLFAKHTFSDIIGESEPIQKAVEWAKRISNSNSTVVIIGRTGTGKEMFAQSIHNNSPRPNGPFVAVLCIPPESLLESELFGYVEAVLLIA
jgi:transcriptional regulator with PAS, ATPase and Fis domain